LRAGFKEFFEGRGGKERAQKMEKKDKLILEFVVMFALEKQLKLTKV